MPPTTLRFVRLALWIGLALVSLGGPAGALLFQSPAFVNDYSPDDNVPGSISNDTRPRIAAAGGHVVVAWEGDKIPGTGTGPDIDIAAARRLSGGGWSSAQVLNDWAASDTVNDLEVSVAGHSGGTFLVAWDVGGEDILGTGVDDDLFYARSTDGGASFGAATALNADATTDNASNEVPFLAGTPSGTWVALHRREELGPGTDPFAAVARSTDDGASFGAPVTLSAAAGRIDPCSIATNGSGTWIAIWREEDGSFGPDFDVLYARSTDDGATWSAPIPMNPNAATDGSDDDESCAGLAYDPVTDLWMASYPGDSAGGTATRTSSDGGANWSTVSIQPLFGFGMIAGTSGQWVMLGLDASSGTREILVRDSTDGGVTWSPDMIVPDRVGLDDFAPAIVGDAGEFFLAWQGWDPAGVSGGGNENDILFSRFPPRPVPSVPPLGLALLAVGLAVTALRLRLTRSMR